MENRLDIMLPTDVPLKEVRVLNTENNTHYFMYLRDDRLRDFFQFMVGNRKTISFGLLPGYSGLTVLGLSAIFARIPARFPIKDIIDWLRNEQKNYLGGYPNPTITSDEICSALGHYAQLVPQLQGDGTNIS